jgi:hypothetical protein
MRFLILFLLACASGLASSVDASATCKTYGSPGGSWVGAVYSASCYDGFSSAEGEVSISGAWAEVSAGAGSFGGALFTAGASASLVADYVLTVTGATGEGFFVPTFSGSFGGDMWDQVSGGASIGDNSGNGCDFNLLYSVSSCGNTFMPFVFDTPETLSVSLSLSGSEGAAQFDDDYFVGGAIEGCCSFEFFANLNEPPLSGVSYTLVPAPGETPTPEPGTFLLFAGAGCASLLRRLLR